MDFLLRQGMTWLEVLQDYSDLIGVLIAAGGFVFLAYQILQVQKSIRSNSLVATNQQLHDIRRIFLESPEYRPYFYEGRPIDPSDSIYPSILTIAEMYLNNLEFYAVERSVFRKENSAAWSAYVTRMLENSPIMRTLLRDNRDLYSPHLWEVAKLSGTRDAGSDTGNSLTD